MSWWKVLTTNNPTICTLKIILSILFQKLLCQPLQLYFPSDSFIFILTLTLTLTLTLSLSQIWNSLQLVHTHPYFPMSTCKFPHENTKWTTWSLTRLDTPFQPKIKNSLRKRWDQRYSFQMVYVLSDGTAFILLELGRAVSPARIRDSNFTIWPTPLLHDLIVRSVRAGRATGSADDRLLGCSGWVEVALWGSWIRGACPHLPCGGALGTRVFVTAY